MQVCGFVGNAKSRCDGSALAESRIQMVRETATTYTFSYIIKKNI